jgi:hypothetical protein
MTDPHGVLVDHARAALEAPLDDHAAISRLQQRHGGNAAAWAAAVFGAARREREDHLCAEKRRQREIADAEERET